MTVTPLKFDLTSFDALQKLDGRFELYKTTAEHEGAEGRTQHGFPSQDAVAG